jgi:hypothetical protein
MGCPKIVACLFNSTNLWLKISRPKPAKTAGIIIKFVWSAAIRCSKFNSGINFANIDFRANSIRLCAFLLFLFRLGFGPVYFSGICSAIFIAGNLQFGPKGLIKCGKVNPNKMIFRRSGMMHFALSSDPLLKNATVQK